jgi:hypothetical protein
MYISVHYKKQCMMKGYDYYISVKVDMKALVWVRASSDTVGV